MGGGKPRQNGGGDDLSKLLQILVQALAQGQGQGARPLG